MPDVSDDKAVSAIDAFINEQGIDTSSSDWKTGLSMPPRVDFDPAHCYFWDIETSVGNIVVQLMPEIAPMHCASTIYLSRLGFYDELAFHRVIDGFMAQGGCPLGMGTGGPGYKYDGEYDVRARHDRAGLLSMANAGPGTDGSQFFLTFVATPHLDDKHTIFGEVVDGQGTLEGLEACGSRSGKTTEPMGMIATRIRVMAESWLLQRIRAPASERSMSSKGDSSPDSSWIVHGSEAGTRGCLRCFIRRSLLCRLGRLPS